MASRIARDAQGCEFAGQDGLGEAGGHKALGRQVVDFVGLVFLEDANQTHLIEQIALHDLNLVLNVADSVKIQCAGTSHHTDHIVSFFKQQICQIAAVLAGHTCDQCCWHRFFSPCKT